MQISAENTENYISKIPEDRQEGMQKLIETIRKNIPEGFTEMMQYSMPSWSISLEDYAPGYHCTPNTPLPFLSVANQKNSINFYHMGVYMKPELLEWFQNEFPKHSKKKLDMGKSCVRFKKPEDIPFELVGELVSKMKPEEYIAIYEKNLNRKG